MTLLEFHQGFSWVVVVSNAVVASWALAADRWEAWRRPSLWWCTGAAQVTILAQAVVGVAVQSRTGIEAPEYHNFYGFVALIAAVLIYSYRQQVRDRQYLLYGLGGLFVTGLAIRAMLLS